MTLTCLVKYKFGKTAYYRRLSDKLVIYDIRDKQFRYLNNIGALIFELAESSDNLDSLAVKVASQFPEVPHARIRNDVLEFTKNFSEMVSSIRKTTAHSFEKTKSIESYRYVADYYIKNKRPLEVGIELTGYCNCACVHCYLPRAKYQWTHEQFVALGESLFRENAYFLSLTGGEIFLNRATWDILDYATSKFPVALLTNGTLFNEEKCERLATYPLDCVNISFYGATAETHDAITKVKGSYAKTIQTVRHLKELGVNVWGRFILMEANADEFEQFCNSWRSEGLNYNVTYLLQNDYKDQMGVKDLRVDPAVIASFIKRGLLDPPKNKLCFAGLTKCRINHQGDFYTCELLPIAQGNVHKDGFGSIWNRNQHRQPPKKFGCPGLGYLEHGNFKEKYTYTDDIKERLHG